MALADAPDRVRGAATASSLPALTTGTALMASYSFGKRRAQCNMTHVMAHNA
jgi:hypothetical protein